MLVTCDFSLDAAFPFVTLAAFLPFQLHHFAIASLAVACVFAHPRAGAVHLSSAPLAISLLHILEPANMSQNHFAHIISVGTIKSCPNKS